MAMKKSLLYILFSVNLLIIVSFWWAISGKSLLNSPSPSTVLIVFGRIAGLLAVYFILVQLLVIGRVKWIEKIFGLDRLSLAHHWLGIGAFLLIVLHFLLLLAGYAQIYELSWIGQFWDFLTNWEELLPATISLILFIITIIGSITLVKKRMKYENWYYVHLISYLAILLAYSHQLESGFDLNTNHLFAAYWILLYVFTGINFVFYRFFWQIYLFKKHQFYVDKIVTETIDTTSIYIKGNKINEFSYKAGQFGIFRFLNKKIWPESHPYSFSDIPGKEYLRITVKNLGDSSATLKDISIGTKVIIDGPNGIFTEKEKQKDKILLIAGGVGITPIRALIEQLAKNNKNLVLLYSARRTNQIIFKQELEDLAKKYSNNLKVHYITSEEESDSKFKLINEVCISCLVPDIGSREAYICGPSGMMMSLKKQLISLGINKSNIYYEKFSF